MTAAGVGGINMQALAAAGRRLPPPQSPCSHRQCCRSFDHRIHSIRPPQAARNSCQGSGARF